MIPALKRLLVGQPLSTEQSKHERLGKVTALAIFASDMMSSVAYATEEILLVLILGGTVALQYSPPIGIAIGLLAATVASSYWQTIHAYPSGGGAYVVASDNLGALPGLIAGAALLVDYVLTVAVSTASGVAAITSAFPTLFPHRVAICVGFVILVMVANLRGIRETGRIFAAPTYWFIGCLALLVGGGFYHLFTQGAPPPPQAVAAQESLTIFLILRAFSGGCAALTGTEAVANGVQYFRPPESRNAGVTLVWMASILALSFLGVTFLAYYYHIVPRAEETVVSMLASQLFGRGVIYYMIQVATAVILLLAVNTSFAGFPMLASIMAKDRFLPRQFANLGDRLVFSNGILILAAVSCFLLVAFGGSTHALIPLYAIGVFTAFTLSQAGMVKHWWREQGPRWQARAGVNALGALATAVVVAVIAATKFTHGAWIVIVITPLMILGFYSIRRHYDSLRGTAHAAGIRAAPDRAPPGRRSGGRPASRRGDGPHVCAGPLAQRHGHHRGPGFDGHRTPSPAVGRMGSGHSPRRPGLPLPRGDPSGARLHRQDGEAAGGGLHDHHPARVRPRQVVAAPAAQPDGALHQDRPAVPPGQGRHQHPVPPRPVAPHTALPTQGRPRGVPEAVLVSPHPNLVPCPTAPQFKLTRSPAAFLLPPELREEEDNHGIDLQPAHQHAEAADPF